MACDDITVMDCDRYFALTNGNICMQHLQEKVKVLESEIHNKSKALQSETDALQDQTRKLAETNVCQSVFGFFRNIADTYVCKQAECTSLKDKLSSAEQALSATCEANEQLRSSLDVLTRDSSSIIAIRAKDALVITELQLKVSDLQDQLRIAIDDSVKQKALSLQNSLSTQQVISALDRKHAELTTELNKERALSELLRNDLKSLQLKAISEEQLLQDTNTNLIAYAHDLEMKVQEVSQKLNDRENEINDMKETAEDLRVKCRDISSTANDYQERLLSLQEESGSLRSQNKELLIRFIWSIQMI
jgi:FtsZ-binding cell division protein ZapB